MSYEGKTFNELMSLYGGEFSKDGLRFTFGNGDSFPLSTPFDLSTGTNMPKLVRTGVFHRLADLMIERLTRGEIE